jgi:hypothetical protein
LYRNRGNGTFADVTRHARLEGSGCGSAAAAGDFDRDGRLDLVAGNWGRNSKSERHRARPLELDYADFDDDGVVEVIEGYFDPGLRKIVPARQLDVLARSLPFLRARYPSHRAFSLAGIADLLGDRVKEARRLEAIWLESTVFLNCGDYSRRLLPIEAQMSPAFGIVVADFDGDGSQISSLPRTFAVQPETVRLDGDAVWSCAGTVPAGLWPCRRRPAGWRWMANSAARRPLTTTGTGVPTSW